MRPRRPSSKREPVISLINIVFLILIFFMVAGSLSSRDTGGISFVQTRNLECCVEPGSLAITENGRLIAENGLAVAPDVYFAGLSEDPTTVRLMPDRNLPATELLTMIQAFKNAGAERILIVTESAE